MCMEFQELHRPYRAGLIHRTGAEGASQQQHVWAQYRYMYGACGRVAWHTLTLRMLQESQALRSLFGLDCWGWDWDWGWS